MPVQRLDAHVVVHLLLKERGLRQLLGLVGQQQRVQNRQPRQHVQDVRLVVAQAGQGALAPHGVGEAEVREAGEAHQGLDVLRAVGTRRRRTRGDAAGGPDAQRGKRGSVSSVNWSLQ